MTCLYLFLIRYCLSIVLMGPDCFTFERFAHRPVPAFLNRSMILYGNMRNFARHEALVALSHDFDYTFSIDLLRGALPPIPWVGQVAVAGPPVLALRELCFAVIERQALGIRTTFRHPYAILWLGLGCPLDIVPGALFGGMVFAQRVAYLSRALATYRLPLLGLMYRLRHTIPQPNFVTIPGGGNIPANTVMVHIRTPERRSVNVKELSHNSLPAVPGYLTIKGMIDNQYALFGLPPPHSATTISSDRLQPE